VPRMAKSVYVQDERYVAVPRMAKSVYVRVTVMYPQVSASFLG